MAVLVLFIKWKKVLRVVIVSEIGRLLILGRFYVMYSAVTVLLVLILVFLVGEALVLLSAFYFSLQAVGVSNGNLMLA